MKEYNLLLANRIKNNPNIAINDIIKQCNYYADLTHTEIPDMFKGIEKDMCAGVSVPDSSDITTITSDEHDGLYIDINDITGEMQSMLCSCYPYHIDGSKLYLDIDEDFKIALVTLYESESVEFTNGEFIIRFTPTTSK